ncbi:MAG: TatD family hydrolase [Desulfobacterales bacterium]
MRLFDSHCHLDDRVFDEDIDAVLGRARVAGVVAMMVVGIDETASRKATGLAETHPGLFASVGVHPHDAKSCSEAVLDRICKAADHPRIKAWGETGLDFNRLFSPRGVQERWFIRQIDNARALDLPLIFHERDSGGRFTDILRAHGGQDLRGVVHCFSGTPAELRDYLDLGLYIGITGILTVKGRGAELREMVTAIPGDRLLVETDAPYLTPVPERNRYRRNEPAFVKSTFLKLCEIRGEPPEALASTLWDNTCRLYGIGEADLPPRHRWE